MARLTVDCSVCQVVAVVVERDEDGLPDTGACLSCREKATDRDADDIDEEDIDESDLERAA